MKKPCPVRDAIRAACKQAGAHGLTSSQMRESIPNMKWNNVRVCMDKMCAVKQLIGVGPKMRKRWFTDSSLADAFSAIAEDVIALDLAQAKLNKKQRQQVYDAKRRGSRDWSAEYAARPKKKKPRAVMKKDGAAPVTIKRDGRKLFTGEVVIPPGVKVTKVPGFVGHLRWLPDAPSVDGFASLGVGRYIDEPC